MRWCCQGLFFLFFAAFFLPVCLRGNELGESAYLYTKQLLAIGPRSILDKGHRQAELFLEENLTELAISFQRMAFFNKTFFGKKSFVNYWARVGKKKLNLPMVVLAAHYDSKYFPHMTFLGANDSASAVGLLLALGAWYKKNPPHVNLELLFLDGEEALISWSPQDSLYGSRWLSRVWAEQSRQKEDLSFVLLDMVGVSDPRFCREIGSSDPSLVQEIWNVADRLGWSDVFSPDCTSIIEDDQVPFAKQGFRTTDIIPYPFPIYWHTKGDNLAVVNSDSLEIVAQVLQEWIAEKGREQF